MPDNLKGKYVLIKPIESHDLPDVVIVLVNPAQAGRIIGLVNFKDYGAIQLLPNQPTCVALFAPLVTNTPHVNFIDYYDRYHQGQGCVQGEFIWPETNLLISLSLNQFKDVFDSVDKSSQGSFKRIKLNPKPVDPI